MLYEQLIAGPARKWPAKVAVIFEDRTYTYADIKTRTDVLAENLKRLGLKKGDFASNYLPNSVDSICFKLACFKLGITAAPIRPNLEPDHVRHIVNQTKTKMILTNRKLAIKLKDILKDDLLKEGRQCVEISDEKTPTEGFISFDALLTHQDTTTLPKISDDTPATVLFTSGSTGLPKGAIHEHGQWFYSASLSSKNHEHDDATYVILSTDHCYGLGEQIFGAFLKGATVILNQQFSPPHFIQAATNGITIQGQLFYATSLYAVPSMYHALMSTLEAKPISHHIKLMDVAGDLLPPVVKQKINTVFGDVLQPSYGMTECLGLAEVSSRGENSQELVLGTPRKGVQYKIFKPNGEEVKPGEIGELCVLGPTVTKRYINSNKREEDVTGGFFRTGDAVYEDSKGQLIYVNRFKRLMVGRDGFMLNPREIESRIEDNPKVTQTLSFDTIDKSGAMLIIALATVKDKSLTAKMIFDMFEKVGKDHKPNIVEIKDQFETGSTGKVKWRFYQDNAKHQYETPQTNLPQRYDDRVVQQTL